MSEYDKERYGAPNVPEAMANVSPVAAPSVVVSDNGSAIPVNAVIVDENVHSVHSFPEATVVEATPVHDEVDRERERTLKSGVCIATALCMLSFVFFIMGCATMNYVGYGAGAWYAALFQFFASILFLSGGKNASCNMRTMVVSALVVAILADILTFIGMVADFFWMSLAKAHDVCDDKDVVVGTYSAELITHDLMNEANDCDHKCLAVMWETEEFDADTFCYENGWGTCSDFCKGDFPHMAGSCGGFGLVTFFIVVTFSIIMCCGLCNQRRY